MCRLAVTDTERIQSGRTPARHGRLCKETLQSSAKRIDNPRGAACNGSDGRLGGRTAVTTLSVWLERTDARVGLLGDRILKTAIEDRIFGLAIEVGLRCKLVLTCRTGSAPRRKRNRIQGNAR